MGRRVPVPPLLRTLRGRSTAVVVGLLLFASGISALGFLQLTDVVARHDAVGEAKRVASFVASASRDALRQQDWETLQGIVEDYARRFRLSFLSVRDPQGRIRAAAGDCLGQTYLPVPGLDRMPTSPLDTSADSDAYLSLAMVLYPVRDDSAGASGADMGRVEVGVPSEELQIVLAGVRTGSVALYGLLALTLTPLGVLTMLQVFRPVERLVRRAERLVGAATRDDTQGPGGCHIQRLGSALSSLMLKLDHQTRQLATLAESVEEEIARRAGEMRDWALRDPVSGLYNRRYFEEVFRARFAEARRHREPLCLMVLDIDNFKAVNDSHGHHFGDRVLGALGLAIASQMRSSDTAARYGGDEFVVLMPHTALNDACQLAQRIRRQFAAVANEQWGGLRLTISVGVAALDPDRDPGEPNALFIRADEAMYEAKRNGKDRIVFREIGRSGTIAPGSPSAT